MDEPSTIKIMIATEDTEDTEVLSACRYTPPAKDAKEQDICPQMNADKRR